ncbi:MAG: hypothetical protein ACRCYY_16610 [Trueperaceae bacterium]
MSNQTLLSSLFTVSIFFSFIGFFLGSWRLALIFGSVVFSAFSTLAFSFQLPINEDLQVWLFPSFIVLNSIISYWISHRVGVWLWQCWRNRHYPLPRKPLREWQAHWHKFENETFDFQTLSTLQNNLLVLLFGITLMLWTALTVFLYKRYLAHLLPNASLLLLAYVPFFLSFIFLLGRRSKGGTTYHIRLETEGLTVLGNGNILYQQSWQEIRHLNLSLTAPGNELKLHGLHPFRLFLNTGFTPSEDIAQLFNMSQGIMARLELNQKQGRKALFSKGQYIFDNPAYKAS